ncbi:MAG: polyribonucleotide nucleotidyltransferase, partial [Gammaproteobacteria bacterium]|nr:polyribonucleotide nucleotidyltransferase [Gammaproteobacteria bacterium]
MNPIKKTVQYGNHTLTFETGEIARQAGGAVIVSLGETQVLATVVGEKNIQRVRDFFPMTVDYQERTYAAGKIPGGFFRREGRPSVQEILTARLIDRPIRPLFPKGFHNEVQIILTVINLDPEINPDIPAMIGASAALAISGLPFNGPIGAARVGYKDGEFILNPTRSELLESSLDLVVSGTEGAVLMVESEAQELPEQLMLDSVLFGHQQQQLVIRTIRELAAEVDAQPWTVTPLETNTELAQAVADLGADRIGSAYRIADKMERYGELGVVRGEIVEELSGGEE